MTGECGVLIVSHAASQQLILTRRIYPPSTLQPFFPAQHSRAHRSHHSAGRRSDRGSPMCAQAAQVRQRARPEANPDHSWGAGGECGSAIPE
jgi:hypothetical protein